MFSGIKLELSEEDEKLLVSLLDGATKFYGAAAVHAVSHILKLIEAAKNPEKSAGEIEG